MKCVAKGNHICNSILIYYSMVLAAQDIDIKLLSELTTISQSAKIQCVCPKQGFNATNFKSSESGLSSAPLETTANTSSDVSMGRSK